MMLNIIAVDSSRTGWLRAHGWLRTPSSAFSELTLGSETGVFGGGTESM